MQMVWFMTLVLFAVAFFLIFFAVYFFRPKKDDKIVQESLERELIDPENITVPHRAEPNWPAIIQTSSGQNGEAFIASVSHGSAFMTSTQNLPVGEKFQLTINLPDRPPLQLQAEVTWSNLHLPPEKVIKQGMGIRFLEAGEDAVSLINDTIEQQAKAFKDEEKIQPG